jgi:hypothetical protein
VDKSADRFDQVVLVQRGQQPEGVSPTDEDGIRGVDDRSRPRAPMHADQFDAQWSQGGGHQLGVLVRQVLGVRDERDSVAGPQHPVQGRHRVRQVAATRHYTVRQEQQTHGGILPPR